MKHFFTFISAILIGSTAMTQVAFQSDFSSWANGLPTDWVGSKTSLSNSNISEVTSGATYGTSMVKLVNVSTSHKRFTTQSVAVTGGTTYEVNMWVSGLAGDLRTAYYDLTNASWSSYNNYVDVGTVAGTTQTLVTQSITVPATCSSIELILSLRSTDTIGIVIDSVSLAEPANPPTPVPHTIAELQNNGGNTSAYEDSLTITSGVVTAIRSGEGYWIQDGIGAWTGIYVDDNVNVPSRGDSVTVTGKVAELFGITKIELITNYVVEPTPTVPITPSVVSSSDLNNLEDWEGVLVQVQAGECVNDDANFGQWTINNGTTPADSVLVDDDLYSFTPTLGTVYDVTGIGHYSYSATKLLPRDANDITTSTTGIEETPVTFEMFPNPANEYVIIKSAVPASFIIYNISGKVMNRGNMNSTEAINVSGLSSGVYMVQLIAEGKARTQKLIIE